MKTLFLLLLITATSLTAATVPLEKLSKADQKTRIQSDAASVVVYREGLSKVLTYAAGETNLFPATPLRDGRMLRREEKEKVWNTWKSFLDYMVALEAIGNAHKGFYRLSGEQRNDSFLVRHAACLAQCRFALGVIDRLENDPGFNTLLNEPVPEIGLPARTFAQLKYRFLHLQTTTELGAMAIVGKTTDSHRYPQLANFIREDMAKLGSRALRTEKLTAQNAVQIVKQTGASAWLPVQTGIAEWMGDTKVYRQHKSLISHDQIQGMVKRLEPGDVIISRHEWYLSNVGLPGFWPHAALYIATSPDRQAYFADPKVESWVKQQGEANGDLENLLRTRHPQAYATSLRPKNGAPPRVLEAISEGVSFTSLEFAADADSLVVLRPRLDRREKAQALARAFQYSGRPYDFNFDFATDATLVCSELVYKSYEPGSGMSGIHLPLVEVLGRKTLPANEIVKQFDTDYGSARQQFDMVLFYDGYERIAKALEADLEAFRASWKRPKWHILIQNIPGQSK